MTVSFFPGPKAWMGNCNTGAGMIIRKSFVVISSVLGIMLICNFSIHGQESILSSYERNFIRASLPEKARVLTDAALDERADEFIGSLYNTALSFALFNGETLKGDPDMTALVAAAARGTAAADNRTSVSILWELFRLYNDSYSRVEILGALAALGKENSELIENLNGFLSEQNASYRRNDYMQTGSQDYPVIRACIAALGKLGESSSFPVVFSAMTSGYPQIIIQETLKAMESIQGDYKDFLVDVIRNNPFSEKAAAFRIGAYNEKLTPEERGELAQTALEISLENSGPAELSLRYDAITILTRLKWSPAASLAVRNFYQVQADFSGGIIPMERLLEAIACLGVMSSSEAAQALALQLGFINSETERTGKYDEAIALAIINSLGELADKAAFDNLLYIGYLNYPDKIQAAAREALNRLKW